MPNLLVQSHEQLIDHVEDEVWKNEYRIESIQHTKVHIGLPDKVCLIQVLEEDVLRIILT